MITLEQARELHHMCIVRFGGVPAIRDLHELHAAINRAWQSYFGQDVFPTVPDQAAALLHALIIRHPFVDGNKRIGLALMLFHLHRSGYQLTADPEALYAFVMDIARGELRITEARAWLRAHAYPPAEAPSPPACH